MRVEEELAAYTSDRETVLTVGVFDGVHLGHQYLIEYLRRQAFTKDILSGVVTFRKHPQQLLSPATKLPYLTGLDERIRILKELGVDIVVPLSFTKELADLSARDFLSLLQRYLKMKGMVVGPDFALGSGREGDVFMLNALGKEMAFTVDVVSPREIEGGIVSSTAIRKALANGEVTKVRKLLGHHFMLGGSVVHGIERGRDLGFPTSNIEVDPDQALPGDGVYVTRAYLGGNAYPSVTNIGRRPTFGGGERTIEVYLLDFSGELYGRELKIELISRLRESL